MNDRRPDVRAYIRERLSEQVAIHGVDPAAIDDDFDVIADGGLDSLGFLELVTDIETLFGHELDLGSYDVERVTLVGTLADAAKGPA